MTDKLEDISMDNPNLYSNITMPETKNGSILSIGKETQVLFYVDQHFNLFQKLMWKWCFGIKVVRMDDVE